MQEAKVLSLNDEQQIQKEVDPLVETATEMTVSTVGDKEMAVQFVKQVNDSIKKVKDFFAPMKSAAKAAHQAVCDREKEVLSKAEEAKALTLQKVSSYDQEQERIRREEEERLREKARKEYEKALEKAQAKLEAIMAKASDSQETIDLLEMELKRDDLSDVERLKLESQIDIEQAKLENSQEKAEALQQRVAEPTFMEPVIVPRQEKVTGAVSRTDYEVRVVNPKAVIEAVAKGTVPVSCVKINEMEIKRFIAMNNGEKMVPGVSFRKIIKTHVRG